MHSDRVFWDRDKKEQCPICWSVIDITQEDVLFHQCTPTLKRFFCRECFVASLEHSGNCAICFQPIDENVLDLSSAELARIHKQEKRSSYFIEFLQALHQSFISYAMNKYDGLLCDLDDQLSP